MKRAITGPISLLIGIIILKVFLPAWLVVVIMGSVIVASVYFWVINKTHISPVLAKKIAIIAIVLFILNAGFTLTEKSAPWLSRAMKRLQVYGTFWVTDKVDPGYDARAAIEKYKTRELLITAEMEKQIRIQKNLQERILKGETIDTSLMINSEKRIDELQEELRKLRLGRENEKKSGSSVIPKIFLFGAVILGAGFATKLATKNAKGNFFLGFGSLILFIWLFLAIFVPELESYYKKEMEAGNVKSRPRQESPSANYSSFRFPMKAGEPSVDMYVMPSGRPCWADWWGPEETQILNRDSQVMGPLFKEYNVNEFYRGVRFQCPTDGIVMLFQGSRKEDVPSRQKMREIWEKEQELFLRAKANSPPPDLAYLGKDLKQLKFRENQYFVRSAQWYIRLISVGIIDGGKLRLDFLHVASKKGNALSKPGTVWIENPDATMYLTDKAGNKLYYAGEKNFGGMKIGKQGPYIGDNEMPPEVPYAYSFIFSKPAEDTREVNFVSKYSRCWNYFNNGCMNSEKIDVVIGNIILFKEKRLLADGDVPLEKDKTANTAM